MILTSLVSDLQFLIHNKFFVMIFYIYKREGRKIYRFHQLRIFVISYSLSNIQDEYSFDASITRRVSTRTILSPYICCASFINSRILFSIFFIGQHEEDELDQLQEGDNESSGDDHYIDPALKGPSRSRRNRIPESITVREAPPDFASNTGNFRALPSTSTDSGRNVVGNALKFAASDYTHISQAIAHQPLAVNPSLQTVELMKKMAQAALPRESEVDRMSAFMTEVSNQVNIFVLLYDSIF